MGSSTDVSEENDLRHDSQMQSLEHVADISEDIEKQYGNDIASKKHETSDPHLLRSFSVESTTAKSPRPSSEGASSATQGIDCASKWYSRL